MTTHSQLVPGDLRESGQWRLWRGVTVLISCPECGKRIECRRANYHVTDDGIVRPAIECPTCDFHNYVDLQEWEG